MPRIEQDQINSPTLEPMGFPVIDDTYTTVTWDDVVPRFTIAPVGAFFDVWVRGRRFRKTGAESLDGDGTDFVIAEGVWFFYYDSTGTLQASQTPWLFDQHAPVAIIRWDATNSKAILRPDERHGLVMSWATHKYLHETVRTRYESGLGITGSVVGTGALDADAQIDVSDGEVDDEDIDIEIADGVLGRFVQELAPIANIPVLYLDGATPVWRRQNATLFPVLQGISRIAYNLDTAGTWSQPDAPSNGNFVAMWISATSNRSVPSDGVAWEEPVIVILGQRVDGNLSDAQNNNTPEALNLPSELVPESKLIYRLIFQTSATYGNTPHARLRDILDYRETSTLPGGVLTATHNSLGGRSTYPTHPESSLSGDVLDKAISYAMLISDFGTTIRFTGAGVQTLTLYSLAASEIGRWVEVVKGGTGNVVISIPVGYTLYYQGTLYTGPTTFTISDTRQRLNFVALTATEWNVIDGCVASDSVPIERFSFDASSFDTPNNADWDVDDEAPAVEDTNNAALTVRTFDDTTEEAVGWPMHIPAGTTSLKFCFQSRAETGPVAARTVGLKLYFREVPDNSAVPGVWSSYVLDDLDMPITNEYFQADEQEETLATLGLTAGKKYMFELSRVAPGAGVNLTGDWDLWLMDVECIDATVPSGSRNTYWFADNVRSPLNNDWAPTGASHHPEAPLAADDNNAALKVRLFDDTTEEGIGFPTVIPDGATQLNLRFMTRAAGAGGGNVGLKMYYREIPDNAAVSSTWNSLVLTDVAYPANEYFQEDTQLIAFSTFSPALVAGKKYQFEFTRIDPASGELSGDMHLWMLGVEFS